MMVFLAPLFGLFGLNFPLGVLIYWVTTNSWTLAQQHYIFKRYPTPDPKAQGGAPATGGSKPSGGAKPAANGSAAKQPNTLAARRARLKKQAEQDGIQDDVHETPKVVRKQPVRQSRSKRTGSQPKR